MKGNNQSHIDEAFAHEEPRFARAARAVVTADAHGLRQLLADHPDLVHARSRAAHRAMLLHFVASNGIDDALQATPGTIYRVLQDCADREAAREHALEIARILLGAGAEVDATCDMYGGQQQTALVLVVSSCHPRDAGVQADLVHVLCAGGAKVDGPDGCQEPLYTALAHGMPQAVKALFECGARIDNLVTAAAAGRLDLVQAYFTEAGALREDVGVFPAVLFKREQWPSGVAEQALVYACMCGQRDVVAFLLDKGVDIDAIPSGSPRTAGPIHTAALALQPAVVRLLIDRGADLWKREPQYCGDPLSWAEHSGSDEIIQMIRDARRSASRARARDAMS
jgi:hypothetical protein